MTDDLRGLDAGHVEHWLADHLDGRPPYSFELIAAGGSNLTFTVTDSAMQVWALRRPPEGRALATAHDVDREWRILSALHGTGGTVPVPRPIVRCDDLAITGAPFFVMEFVDGVILRTEEDGAALAADDAVAASDSLMATHAALHAIDPDDIGLGELGRRSGYVERQLHRWKSQVDKAAVRNVPLIDELHRRLAASVPAESPTASVVHGDYRFDNVVIGAEHQVAAVLDWELCTLGDPVADACWSLQYWADPGDEAAFLPSSPTLAASMPDRRWAAEQYESLSGRSLAALPWFEAFGWWKMACIVEGVHARRRSGSRGGLATGSIDGIAASVDHMIEVAAAAASDAGI